MYSKFITGISFFSDEYIASMLFLYTTYTTSLIGIESGKIMPSLTRSSSNSSSIICTYIHTYIHWKMSATSFSQFETTYHHAKKRVGRGSCRV
jgi:hypothetical protein